MEKSKWRRKANKIDGEKGKDRSKVDEKKEIKTILKGKKRKVNNGEGESNKKQKWLRKYYDL